MKQKIQRLRKKYKEIDIVNIEKALVHSYLEQNSILYENDVFFKQYFSSENVQEQLLKDASESIRMDVIDDLISAFEMLIGFAEKKENGMVYTPLNIKQYIVEQIIVTEQIPLVVDPACGCGSFLVTAMQHIKKTYGVDYSTIIDEYVEGFDIDSHSIEKAEVILNVLALQEEGKSIGKIKRLHVANSLDELSKSKYRNKYDVVIGNPPYVRLKNIDVKVRRSLSNWTVVSGNVDLYIPFYEMACEILKDSGRLGFISPNTFLQSVNGRGLRNYLVNKLYEIKILDFREAQAFKEITHYTCITILNKGKENGIVNYALLNGKSSLNDYEFTEYNLQNNKKNQEWRFSNKDIDSVIQIIENQPHKLDDYRIRNGLATLCNEIFFFTAEDEDETYFYREYAGEYFPIEKALCIDVAKPNIMRSEEDLESKMEKAIFPYNFDHTIIDEETLRENFPKAYCFLQKNKAQLLQRDKGKAKNYPAWYAYGRTQGMNNQGKKLLIPYMAERGVAIKSYRENVLFYCGYALFCDDDKTMEVLKRIIESKVFWYYIENTSKPYSKGYMALAKNYIKNFGIPNLTETQADELINMPMGTEREKLIADFYDVKI